MSEEVDTTAVENWQARAEYAESALADEQAKAAARLIRAELKAEAIRAGMIDLDGLKLLDMTEIKLSQAGDVPDAEAILATLKRTKPWLFQQQSSSSASAHAPRPEPPRTRHANELSHEEWLSARANLLRRR